MKINKVLKVSLIILIIILLSIISFLGIFVKDKNKMSNVVKEYTLGMDLEGSRRIELDISTSKETINYDKDGNKIESTDTTTEVATTEEKAVNEESVLTIENYKLTKKIIEKRLKTMGLNDYEIRLNETNGKIIMNIPEDDNTDLIVAQMQYQGKFEVVDKDTNEVLMTNDDLKSVKAGYGTNNSGTTVIFVNIQFNKEGTQKFKDITNNYTEITTTDSETGEETTAKKEIAIKVDDSTLLTTNFNEEVSNGLLQLSMGSASSSSTPEELQESLITANNLAALLDNDKSPIVYEITQNKYVASEVTSDNIGLFVSLCIVVTVIGMIYLIVKYKEKGILASITLVGYIAILLLVLRYTNVAITLDGIVAIVLSSILNYILIAKILKYNLKIENDREAFKRAMAKFVLTLVPVCIIAIVFTFNSWLPIFSFGMVMFWGIVVNLLYNLAITRTLLLDFKN